MINISGIISDIDGKNKCSSKSNIEAHWKHEHIISDLQLQIINASWFHYTVQYIHHFKENEPKTCCTYKMQVLYNNFDIFTSQTNIQFV